MQTESSWTLGPPPDGGGQWIVEDKHGGVYRVKLFTLLTAIRVFTTLCGTTVRIEAKDILRHMPYVPMPELPKPFRRFDITQRDGKKGRGAELYGGTQRDFFVLWDNGDHEVYFWTAIEPCQIEWIDDET